jgi:hypothetical protein
MKISKLTKALGELQRKYGDAEVLISSDEEGNSFGELGDKQLQVEKLDKGTVIIYPVSQRYE